MQNFTLIKPVKAKHLQAADGIRGAACLSVLIAHFVGFTFESFSPYIVGSGKVGVWLFFVLSAYLLTYKFIEIGFSRSYLTDYLLSRFMRIYPPFALVCLVFALLDVGGVADRVYIKSLLLVEGPWHLWTIPVEFKFYFLLPLVVWVLMIFRKRSLGLFFSICVFLISVHQFFYPWWKLTPNSISLVWYLPCFLFGVMAAFIRVQVSARVADISGCLILLIILFLFPLVRNSLGFDVNYGDLLTYHILLSFLWAIFVVVVVGGDAKSRLVSFFEGSALKAIGRWSYSIYLVHLVFVLHVADHYQGSVVAAVFGFILSIAVGALMYRYVERPFSQLRSWVSRNYVFNGR